MGLRVSFLMTFGWMVLLIIIIGTSCIGASDAFQQHNNNAYNHYPLVVKTMRTALPKKPSFVTAPLLLSPTGKQSLQQQRHATTVTVRKSSSTTSSLSMTMVPWSCKFCNLNPTMKRVSVVVTAMVWILVQQGIIVKDVDATSSTSKVLGGLDINAIGKYYFALVDQMVLITMFLSSLDWLVAKYALHIPFAVNMVLFYFLALKSRIFNPLSNERPQVPTKEIAGTSLEQTPRTMPTWTPPGFVFPIVWLLLIGPLRAITSSMIVQQAGGRYCQPAILALMFHLSIGDIWNTINNVERRYGTSVLGVICVWISAALAAKAYYQVWPLAGKLLSLKLIWLTIATSLIIRTWQINPKEVGTSSSSSTTLAPLLPTKGDGKSTQWTWWK